MDVMQTESAVKIILADGTELNGTINGNNYIFDETVPDSILTDENVVGMTINGETYDYDHVCNHFIEGGKDHVIFAVYSALELVQKRLTDSQATMDYIAMMSDVDLDSMEDTNA